MALLCVAAAALAGAAAPKDGTLTALLNEMRSVNGGLSAAHVVSTAPSTAAGVESTLHADVQGVRYVLSHCSGKVCLGTYFDGLHLYSVNINDTALPRTEEPQPYLRALRIVSTLAFLDPAFTRNGGTVSDGGTVLWHGKRLRKIFVADKASVPMIVFVDPASGLVAGAQDVNADNWYAMRDYRRVGAFELPFEVDRNGQPLEMYDTRRIVPGPLQVPRGIGAASLATGSPAGMPLDPQSVTPLGTCTIAGVSVRCLIDSGNSAMSMSLELAERLGLQPQGMLHVAGLGNYATEVVRAGPLQMGNVRFGDADYVVLPDIHRYGYDLVVGADVLASIPVTIDYGRHALYFGNHDPQGRAGTTVPLHFQNFVPVVDVRLGDLASSLAVDTGDQSTINLGYDYYEQHPGIFKVTKSAGVSGVGGQSTELLGEIPAVHVGSLTAQNQQIGATETLKGTADGHLGAGFLSQYDVVLDYPHQLLRLVPVTPQ